MKKTEISFQEHKVSNEFNQDQFLTALKAQLGSEVFKRLINDENDSLTLEVRIFVNEEEESDQDPEVVKAMAVVKQVKGFIKRVPKEVLVCNMALMSAYLKAGEIDTRKWEHDGND